MMLKNPLMLFAMIVLLSCSGGDDDPKPGGGGGGGKDDNLTSLPADTGGQHLAKQKGTTDADLGYYVYLPGGYNDNTKSYPLLIFLHGKGERGNGTTDLKKVTTGGPPMLIKNNNWKTKSPHPMIVASPQFYGTADHDGNDNNWGGGDETYLKEFIEHMIETYRVNPKRIYITGYSHGGTGVFDYLILQPEASSRIAAAVPIAAWGPNKNFSTPKNTPIWSFCGGTDGNIGSKTGNLWNSVNFITKYNDQSPAPKYKARMTVYPDKGHDGYVWNKTYDLTNVGAATNSSYDPYNMNIYEWMLQYKRSD